MTDISASGGIPSSVVSHPQQELPPGLTQSVPANNWKIIEVFNKIRSNQLIVNTDYQRKLVWKKQHKNEFIDTILRNYPFPEVYLAPGTLDQERLVLIDEIVDGQQRLTTIRDYILGQDVFSLPKVPIKRFSELNTEERTAFLNYEVSIRYLKNVSPAQIREIFQRINKSDYALNKTERLNAQFGESEFVCFCKQIVEPEFSTTGALSVVHNENRKLFLQFFNGDSDDQEGVFSSNDKSRMLALQYVMTLVATLDQGEYFSRNDKVSSYIEGYNESFPQYLDLENRLARIVLFLQKLPIARNARWFNKANLFTFIAELDKVDLESIDTKRFAERLDEFDLRASLCELGLEKPETLSADESKYLDFAREAVNQKTAREYRGSFIAAMISTCLTGV
jgi:hypothetical protein